MNIVNLGRRNGKTVMLVHTAFVTGTPIITSNVGTKENVKSVAKTLGVNVEVYTCEEFRQLHYKNCPILIDEGTSIIEKALEEYFNNKVIGVTFTVPMIELKREQAAELKSGYDLSLVRPKQEGGTE